MSTASPNNWTYLGRKPGSIYRQLFVKGRNIAAHTLYGQYVSAEEPRTIEQIAQDYELPIDAVREAVSYCEAHPDDFEADWAVENALEKAAGTNDPEYRRTGRTRLLSVEEAARVSRP